MRDIRIKTQFQFTMYIEIYTTLEGQIDVIQEFKTYKFILFRSNNTIFLYYNVIVCAFYEQKKKIVHFGLMRK